MDVLSGPPHVQPRQRPSDLYRTLPLSEEGLSVRILQLHSGAWSDPLRCKLVVEQVSANTRFEALCYAHVVEPHPHTVLVNGVPVHIAQHLASALRHFRHYHEDRKLWVDAVCINQDDLEERSVQRLETGQIFRNAEQVLIWLGEGKPIIELAFTWISECISRGNSSLAVPAQELCPRNPSHRARLRRPISGLVCSICHTRCTGNSHDDCLGRLRTALGDIMSRDLWRSLEVFQAIVMAAGDPLVVCGNFSIPWSSLARGHLAMTEAVVRIHQFRLEFRHTQEFREKVAQTILPDHTACSRNLIELLRSTADLWATDARDKIYILLGVVASDRWESLCPDYEESPSELVNRLMLCLNEADDNLDVLTLSRPRERSSATYRSPASWIPNLTTRGFRCLPMLKRLPRGSPLRDLMSRLSRELSSTSHKVMFPNTHWRRVEDGALYSDTSADSVIETYGFPIDTVGELSQDHQELLYFWYRYNLLPEQKPVAESMKLQYRSLSYWFHVWENLDLPLMNSNHQDSPKAILEQFAHDLRAYKSEAGLSMTCGICGIEDNTAHANHSVAYTKTCHWAEQFRPAMNGHRFFVTSQGLIGIGPDDLRDGDAIVLLYGSTAAFALRSVGAVYQLVGSVYLDAPLSEIPWDSPKPRESSWKADNIELEIFTIC